MKTFTRKKALDNAAGPFWSMPRADLYGLTVPKTRRRQRRRRLSACVRAAAAGVRSRALRISSRVPQPLDHRGGARGNGYDSVNSGVCFAIAPCQTVEHDSTPVNLGKTFVGAVCLALLLHRPWLHAFHPPFEWCNHETSSSTPLARARAAVGSARRDAMARRDASKNAKRNTQVAEKDASPFDVRASVTAPGGEVDDRDL
ncbi:hypothetical protein HPB51_010434 [Rhipicephalus microplus]|uniref:Uncharacterized protein n=1 Tax=Rhipicephalus microplus TaxID=6941 RepID=A0A9J6E7N1_RHIMP|nr:hypothetical protein HPB51_010434 [Rhipicephalus microplus]